MRMEAALGYRTGFDNKPPFAPFKVLIFEFVHFNSQIKLFLSSCIPIIPLSHQYTTVYTILRVLFKGFWRG